MPATLQGYDFQSVDDGLHRKAYNEALERFRGIEERAAEEGVWLPEDEEERKVRMC